jgi:hypothetical protein
VQEVLVVDRSQIELRENPGTMEFIKELFHHWNWELIFDSALIKGPIIHAEPP